MTRISRLLVLAAVTCHLGLATLGALDVCLWRYGPLGRGLMAYSAATGLDNSYGYFAPGVATPAQARFTLMARGRELRTEPLTPGITREGDVRVEDLVDAFNGRRVGAALKRDVAASWAAAMFRRHPDADALVLDVGVARMPPLIRALPGDPTRWKSFYRARVARPPEPTP